ncbi:MAG: hypothetical protein ABI480_13500, partial [Chitinophagaceae bacterium]
KTSVSFDNNVFSIEAAGADIWNVSDQFAFVNKRSSGDGFISARIISQSKSHPWAKSGLMFREVATPQSPYVMICVTPENGVSLQWRDSANGKSLSKIFPQTILPVYLKLTRQGSTFTAYKSFDGIKWDMLTEIILSKSFASDYLAGMAVSSHDTQVLNLSTFDHVKTGKEN